MQNGASSCRIGSEIQSSSMAIDGQTANHHFRGKKQLITFRHVTSMLVIHMCYPETMPSRLDFPISTAHDIPKEAWYHLQLQLVTGTLLREYLVLAHGLAPGRPEISAYIRWNEDAVASGTFGKLGHGNWET